MKLDERSLGFKWPDRTGPFRLIRDEQARQWNEAGYFLLEDALTSEQIRAVTAEIDPLEQQREAWLREKHEGRLLISRADDITFTVHLAEQSQAARDFVGLPVFADLCLDLIGERSRLYWDQAVYKKPRTPVEFPWHQDNGYTFVEPQDYLTCWVPLNDATIENGCPWVMPGVHRCGTLEHWPTELGYECLDKLEDEVDSRAIPVEAKAGDIIVFSSLTPHRTGPNTTDTVRKAYIVQFSHDSAIMYPRRTPRGSA